MGGNVWADYTAQDLYSRIGSDGARIAGHVNNYSYPTDFSSLPNAIFDSLWEPYISKSTTTFTVSKLYYLYTPSRDQYNLYRGTYTDSSHQIKVTYSSSTKTFTLTNTPSTSIMPTGYRAFIGMSITLNIVPPSPFISVKTATRQIEVLNATEDRIALFDDRQIGIQLSDGGKPKFSISVSGKNSYTLTLY